jgi:hypothetical protein
MNNLEITVNAVQVNPSPIQVKPLRSEWADSGGLMPDSGIYLE